MTDDRDIRDLRRDAPDARMPRSEMSTADLSVHHPRVVENYRAARDIALRHRRGQATTEDLRQAMVYYRALFQDVLEDREHAASAEARASHQPERVVERTAARADEQVAARADEGTQIPVQRVNDRPNGTRREVRPCALSLSSRRCRCWC